MSLPLATALAVASLTPPALLTVTAVVAGFLAHEPLMVVTGRRGARTRREHRGDAAWWLGLTLTTTAVAGGLAIWMMPARHRWAFLLPALPAALLAAAIAARREKSAYAEVGVAIAFSLAAVPVCLAGGATLTTAASVAIPFVAIFVTGTLAVRSVILRVRGGGDPSAAAGSRAAAIALTVVGAVAAPVAAWFGLLSWVVVPAIAPGLAVAIAVALIQPSPVRLRAIGWTLAAASAAAAVILATAG